MAKKKVSKRDKKATNENTNKNTNKNKNVINIKIHNNSKKKRSKSKSGQSKSTGQITPYSGFNPIISPNIYLQQPNYPMPNYQQQMVGSGYRDAVYPTQNTRVDMQIPESIANPVGRGQESAYNPYSDVIYSNPILQKSTLSDSTKSIPDSDETQSQVGSYSSMSSYPFSNPSALFQTEKFNIDNVNDNMSEPKFPIYSIYNEPVFNEKSKEYDEFKDENPMKKREAKDAKKINKINQDFYNQLAMDELLKSMPENEISKMKFTKSGTTKLNSKYGNQYKEILKKIMDEDK